MVSECDSSNVQNFLRLPVLEMTCVHMCCPDETTSCSHWSNYSIIYIWWAIASLENFLRPRGPSRSHISGDQNVLLLQFQYKKTLANCNKTSIKKSSAYHRNCSPLNTPSPDFHTAIWPMGDYLAISGGLLQAPLNPLKTDVSRGASRSFRWARPPRALPYFQFDHCLRLNFPHLFSSNTVRTFPIRSM